MVRVEDQLQKEDERDQNGGSSTGDNRVVTITEVEDVDSKINRPSGPVEAVCVRTDSDRDVQVVEEDVSCTSSTQYSDVDDSLEGDELGSWSNDLGLPVSLQQNFDNGVSLPVSEAPTFGDVCVKNSANVHFGNKTFYNGPVTIKQIVYSNPTTIEEKNSIDGNYENDDHPKKQSDYQDSEEFHKGTKWCNWMLTWRCVALICTMGSCLVAVVVISVVFLSREPTVVGSVSAPNDTSINSDVLPENRLNFVERVYWGAQPPNKPAQRLKHPVPYVVISHSATSPCKVQSECTLRIRFAQTFDIESLNWTDIGSNFMIGGDGYAYVARGWDGVAEGLNGYDSVSVGISLIGTFNVAEPSKLQIRSVEQLIEMGIKEGKIASDYKLLALRQIAKNQNPGDTLFNIIKTWPHWVEL